jgi:phosphoribosylformylglycinamidine synthase
MRLAGLLVAGSQDGVLGAAHDVSDGGLAQCLVEMALAGDCGVRVRLPDEDDPFVALFSESVARVVVAVAPDEVTSVERLAGEHGVTVTAIGAVSGDAVDVEGHFTIPVAELRATSDATLPLLFG